MNARAIVCLLLAVALVAGCTPRVRVRKNPDMHDTGVRYYRPKPYLFIAPGGASVEVSDGGETTSVTTSPSDEFVTMELQYLPDFAEEYAIDVCSGLGVADVSFKLEDGWNLTEINQKLDSQTDENIKATADLLKAAGSLVPTGVKAAGGGVPTKQRWVVPATNIPLGYYESVIGRDRCGKRLTGWRYVGFAPFNSCSTQFCGSTTAGCENDPNGPIYGLGFVDGVMKFQQLNTMRGHEKPQARKAVSFGTVDVPKQIESAEDTVLRRFVVSEIEQSVGAAPLTISIQPSAGIEDLKIEVELSANQLSDENRTALEMGLAQTIQRIFDRTAIVQIHTNIHEGRLPRGEG